MSGHADSVTVLMLAIISIDAMPASVHAYTELAAETDAKLFALYPDIADKMQIANGQNILTSVADFPPRGP